ncbi:MAG: hypothetical protein WCJ94_06320 [bacterium]
MSTKINEKIKVGAVFNKEGICPQWFKWKDRRIEVKETTYTWKTIDGAAEVLHFSVVGESGSYELSFNKKTLVWMLEKADG